MGLTYDGITYRSLEEQVRYDAEQVQVLKQADVTINENLQTVNTEINGKLAKPTNPSAESAVTMLADGTVGTKLLSEIGGSGGGKLYSHKIKISLNGVVTRGDVIQFVITSTKSTAYNINDLKNNYYMCMFVDGSPSGLGLLYIRYDYNTNKNILYFDAFLFPSTVTNFENINVQGFKASGISDYTLTDAYTEV